MPYGLKPENVLCANTIALALAKRLVGSTKHENHQNYVQQCMTRNQINDTFLFQNRVKVKVVGDVSEK